jgi:hypothetical protein
MEKFFFFEILVVISLNQISTRFKRTKNGYMSFNTVFQLSPFQTYINVIRIFTTCFIKVHFQL